MTKGYSQMSDTIEGMDDELNAIHREIKADLQAFEQSIASMSAENKEAVLTKVKL